MTRIYCGRCGAAGGVSARYCRFCGAKLVRKKRGGRGVKEAPMATPDEPEAPAHAAPAPEEFAPAPASMEKPAETPPLPTPVRSEDEELQDSVAMLRRLRVSGPLIIEEAMKKQEQMNEIISQALDGLEQSERPEKSATGELAAGQPEAAKPAPASPPQAAISMRSPAPITRPMATGGAGTGQIPPQGPSRVLADVSGLKPGSRIGFQLRIVFILLALLLSSVSYFVFRDRLLGKSEVTDAGRDLMRVEDLSLQYVKLGETDREHGNYEAALGHFQKALGLTPNNPNVLFLVAQTYAQTNQIEESQRAYLDLLRIAPENLEARLQVALIYQNRGNWNAAYREFQRIIALDQNSVQAAMALEAIEAHEVSAGGDSTLPPGQKQRTPKPAGPVLPNMPMVEKEISLQPPRLTPEILLRPPAALDLSQMGEKPDPAALAEARKERGLRYLNIREYRAAINELLIALRLTPEDKDIYYFLGSAYYGLQQYAQAYDYYKRVDRGRYVQVAQSGAKRTEKAAEEYRRRMNLPKSESSGELPNTNKPEKPQDSERINPGGKTMENSWQ